jgi:hypothetical protein
MWPSSNSVVVALAFAAFGCATHYIPNTDVPETELNRRVIEFCEAYRHAVELRNTAALMKMVDPSYYEDGASVDTSDDLDYAGIKQFFDNEFKKTKAIRYEIRYRDVSAGRKNTIFVDYTYTASYKVPSNDGADVWRRELADNRLELVPNGESFKIIAGM